MELEKLASIFEAVRVLPLRPSDLLVFRANAFLDLEQKVLLHDAIEAATGHARILILDGGADLAIVRPEPEPEFIATQPLQDSQPTLRAKTGKAPGAIA